MTDEFIERVKRDLKNPPKPPAQPSTSGCNFEGESLLLRHFDGTLFYADLPLNPAWLKIKNN